jgi:hypothetical protein
MDQQFIDRAKQLADELNSKRDTNPGSVYAPIDDVGVLERDFVRAVAKAQLDNPQVVAQAIAEVGTMADAQLTDEPVTA